MSATRRPSTKKGRSIPIAVTVDPRPAPTNLPPLKVAPAPAQPAPKKSSITNPVSALKAPVHTWPEERRRRLMWWLVGGGATVIVIGWLAIVRFEINTTGQSNLFRDTWNLIRSISGNKTTTPAEQEIRTLDSQVFPQFQ
jgi:hypothetical protein